MHKQNELKKSPALYIVMLCLWTGLTVWLWLNLARGFTALPFAEGAAPSRGLRAAATVLVALNGVFISYFWLNGVKDFLYVIWYLFAKRALCRRYARVQAARADGSPKVYLLYCTCNDFDGESLRACMDQRYDNFETGILDDSSKEEYRRAVDGFAAKHGIRVVRRKDRIGFKAGNINHFLLSDEAKRGGWRYAVILDSDEVIPENFIAESLRYFAAYENVGIVQANHVATRNRNFFMKLFHIGVNSHWPTYQTMKHRYGFSSMLGHGAMIRRDCYEEAGGFPHLVAEDLCLSIELRGSGWYVAFAPNIVCREEYPVDYAAFKKRHSKWTQGNLEFIKRYTGKILRSPMAWYEKLDIVLFTYNLPLTAVFAFYIFLNITFMPALGIDIGKLYPLWMIVPTVIFFFPPMLNDVFTWIFRLNFFRFLFYLVCVVVLYGSMLYTSLVSALLGMFGKKATFIVTPKRDEQTGFWQALRLQYKELLFASALLTLSFVFSDSVLPVILIAATGFLSFFLLFFANKRYSLRETRLNDLQTASISFAQNPICSTPFPFLPPPQTRPAKQKA